MANLVVNAEEFLLERDVVMEERRQRTDDDPTSSVVEEMYASAFKIHPYRNPVIGWMTDLENLSREDLVSWYKTYYRPNNATIIVAGDIIRDELLPRIEKYFGSIPKGPEPPAMNIVEPEQNGERRVWVKREAQLPFIFAGYKVPSIGDPDEYALELLANILSAGRSSRLHRSLVYDRQIAVYAGAKPGVKIEDVELAIYEELEKITKDDVSKTELKKAKNQVEASFIMGQDSIFYQAMMLGRLEAAGKGHKYLQAYLEGVREVSLTDIKEAAKKYFIKDKRTVGILVPEKKEKK